MADITERLRDLARDNGYRGIGEYWNACEEAADEIDRMRARVAELEAARGEPVARCTQYLPGSDCPAPQSCRENGCSAIERMSYTAPPAPTVDVDSIPISRLISGLETLHRRVEQRESDGVATPSDMRAALHAIFNKGE